MSRFWDTLALGLTASTWPASSYSLMTFRNGRVSGGSVEINKDVRVVRIDPTSIIHNGAEVVTGWTRQDSTYDVHKSSIQPFYAFAYGYTGSLQTIAKTGRIYDIMIESDGESHHFRPALDSSGVACFHDEVTGEFKYNSGSGEFLHN